MKITKEFLKMVQQDYGDALNDDHIDKILQVLKLEELIEKKIKWFNNIHPEEEKLLKELIEESKK